MKRILTLSLSLAAVAMLMPGCGSDGHRGAWDNRDHRDDRQISIGNHGNGGDTDMSVSVRTPDHDRNED